MKSLTRATALLGCVTLLSSLPLQAQEWQFSARFEGWLPDTSGETAFPHGPGSVDFEIDIEDVLDNLEWGYMGSFDARNGRWGVYTDLIYASISDSESNYHENSGRRSDLTAETRTSVDIEVESMIITSAGYYRLLDDRGMSLDLLVGFRYVEIDQSLDWKHHVEVESVEILDSSGGGEVDFDNLDALVGVRGRIPLGKNGAWMVPYYVDIGTGDSDFTWQAAAGIGYNRGSLGMGLVWRILSYELDSDSDIADLEMAGPAAVFEYNFQ